PGEAGRLREAPELDRDLVRAFDLVDRMRDRRIRDERLVGGIEEDHRTALAREGDPARELLLRRGGAGRVVRRAEIDEVDLLLRKIRDEAVLGGRRHVDDA